MEHIVFICGNVRKFVDVSKILAEWTNRIQVVTFDQLGLKP
jgi:hypothetical protein